MSPTAPGHEGGAVGAGFRHLGDDVIAELHRVAVVSGRFAAPDGTEFTRDVIRDKAVVAVVPLLDDGETVLLVRQYRGPIDAWLLEIPAGLCDVEGEDDPEVTAQRELAEEVGRRAGYLELLARVHPAAGLTDCHEHLFLATGLVEVPIDREGIEEEHMTVETLSLVDVPARIADGTLTDAKTLIGLLTAREHLGLR